MAPPMKSMEKPRKRKTSATESKSPKNQHSDKKLKWTDYSVAEFKVEVKDPTTTFQAIKKFTEHNKAFPTLTHFDLTAEYCRSSPECEEILKLLEGSRKPSETHAIFEVLEVILLRLSQELLKLRSVGHHIVRKILAGHLGLVYATLAANNKSGHIKAALKLLTMMVMQDSACAKEVQSQLDFSHPCFLPLLNRKDSKDEHDVRTCVLQFMMSFLISGDDAVVKDVVDCKGFLSTLFPGLVGDKLSTIQMVLPVLLEKVVKNSSISKTSKMHLFNAKTLKMVSSLYKWTGPQRWVGDTKKKGGAEELTTVNATAPTEDQENVRDMCHELLLTLCCDQKLGINFFDRSFGTDGKNSNLVLTNYLTSLENVYEDPLVSELVIEAVKSCPDLLHWYLPSFKTSMSPRPSPKWLNCVDFILKVFDHQPLTLPIFEQNEKLSTAKLVSMALMLLVPPKDIWTCVTYALNKPSQVVRHGGLRLLHQVLLRCQATIDHCTENKGNCVNDPTEIVASLRSALGRILPDSKVVYDCWTHMFGTRKEGKKQQKKNQEEEQSALFEVQRSEHLLKILQNICLYQSVVPDFTSQRAMDLPSLLEGVRKMRVDNCSETRMLELYLMKYMSAVDLETVSWMKESAGGRSTLLLLLEMVTALMEERNMSDVAVCLLEQLLQKSGVFRGTEEEITIWLQEVLKSKEEDRPFVLMFLQDALFAVLKRDPDGYVDQVVGLQHRALELCVKKGSESFMKGQQEIQDEFDKMAQMDDEEWSETQDTCVEEKENKMVSNALSLSPLIPAAVQRLAHMEKVKADAIKEIEAVKNYVHRVLLHVWRIQENGVVISLVVHSNAQTLQSEELHRLARKWLPNHMHKGLRKCNKVSVDNVMKSKLRAAEMLQFIFQGDTDLLADNEVMQELASAIDSLQETGDRLEVVRQILQFVRFRTSNNENEPGGAVDAFLALLELLLQRQLESSTAETERANDDTMNKDFAILMHSVPSGSETLRRFFRVLLECDVFTKYFMCSVGTASKGKSTKAERHLSEMISMTVVNIVLLVPQESDISESVQIYKDKTIDCLKYAGKSSVLLSSISALSKYFNNHEVSTCLQYLLNLPREALMDGDRLTANGNLIVTLFRRLLEVEESVFVTICSVDIVRNVVKLFAESNNIVFEQLFLDLVGKSRLWSLAASEPLLENCLAKPTDVSTRLATSLVTHSSVCRKWLHSWCHRKKNKKQLSGQLDKLWPVLHTAALFGSTDEEDFVAKLKNWCRHDEESESLYRGLWHIQESNPEWNPDSIGGKIVRLKYELAKLKDAEKSSFAGRCVQFLLSILSTKEQALTTEQVLQVVETLSTALQDIDAEGPDAIIQLESKTCGQLTKQLLRKHYGQAVVLKLLSLMVGCVDAMSDQADGIYGMVMSHSQFLPTVLNPEATELKGAILDLLTSLVEANPSCCQSSHAAVLFGAYQATLHSTDQKLLKLLHLHEKDDSKLTTYRPYLWGEKALEHHSVRHSLEASLSRQASTEQVLDALDPQLLLQSATQFPLTLTMQTVDVVPEHELRVAETGYDPRFLLPVFCHLTAAESLLSCRRFVEVNCLGYVISALSSHDFVMRGAAYSVLTAFYQQLQGARFPEKFQVVYLLDTLRGSVEEPNQKLHCIISVFFVEAARLMLRPDTPMYRPINEFLLLKPSIDTTNVPEFFKLFNSYSAQRKTEQMWLLRLLENGLRETADFHIFEKRHVFNFLTCSFFSVMSDQQVQTQVLKVLLKGTKTKTIAVALVKSGRLIVWLQQIIHNRSRLESFQGFVLDILCSLWETMTLREPHAGNAEDASHVPLRFTARMLSLFTLFLLRIRHFNSNEELTNYLQCFLSVLDQQAKTVQHFRSQGHSPNSFKLHLHHVLLLLQHWCSLNHDRHLESAVLDAQAATGFKHGEELLRRAHKQDAAGAPANTDGSAANLLKIACHLKFQPLCEGVAERREEVVSIFTIWLMLFHDHCSNKSDIALSLARWCRETVISNGPSVVESLMCSPDKTSENLIFRMIALYDCQFAFTDIAKHKERDRFLNETFFCLLDFCLAENSCENVLSKTVATSSFRHLISRLKHTQNTEWISTLLQETFLQVEYPIHSEILCDL